MEHICCLLKLANALIFDGQKGEFQTDSWTERQNDDAEVIFVSLLMQVSQKSLLKLDFAKTNLVFLRSVS